MKKLLIINATANTGSTGRIAEEIGLLAQQSDFEVTFAFGRKAVKSSLPLWQIGNKIDILWHGVESRLFDNHGFASRIPTREFIRKIEEWNPDIINIHNLHGYYLNIEILINYLKQTQIPIVWTLHDCWPFTGHCSYFDGANCFKWESECNNCPNMKGYPKSWIDNSRANFHRKKALLTGLKKLTIITPSHWLTMHLQRSLLQEYPVKVIHNGIDLETFRSTSLIDVFKNYGLQPKPIILGVANIWNKRKGLADFIRLSEILPANFQIVLVGLTTRISKTLPRSIESIARTESTLELAALYSEASVFVNPTYEDNFPTTNIEALACGTPVVTYNTGGSPEAIDEHTGVVIEKGDIKKLATTIEQIVQRGKGHYQLLCRERAERLFNKEGKFMEYISLFKELV